jgi:hypothetical protein
MGQAPAIRRGHGDSCRPPPEPGWGQDERRLPLVEDRLRSLARAAPTVSPPGVGEAGHRRRRHSGRRMPRPPRAGHASLSPGWRVFPGH